MMTTISTQNKKVLPLETQNTRASMPPQKFPMAEDSNLFGYLQWVIPEILMINRTASIIWTLDATPHPQILGLFIVGIRNSDD